MVRLDEWFIRRKDVLTLLLAVVVSLSLIFSDDVDQMHTVRAWTLAGFGYLLDKVSVFERYQGLYEENHWLREQNAQLMLANSQLREVAHENQRLRALLEFKHKSQLQLVAAKVVGKDENGFIHSILLTAGFADSVSRNMAVVTAQGLAGKVYHVSQYDATAQLLLDRNFRVSAMVQRSRVTGLVKWSEGSQVVLAEVPKRSDVVVGDTVVTSGLSRIFPGGLKIGTVVQVDEDKQGLFMRVVLDTAVDFSKLEEVFVVKKHPVPQ
ncbi:MAG: rod shape-determining protein MreC [bacterium]